MLPRFKAKKTQPKFKTHTAAIIMLIIGVALIDAVFVTVNNDLRNRSFLEGRASTIAATLPAGDIRNIKDLSSSERSSSLSQVNQQLQRIKQDNGDLRSIMVLAQLDGKVISLANSNSPVDTKNNDIYDTQPGNRLTNAFHSYETFSKGPYRSKSDVLLSAAAPIVDPKTKEIVGLTTVEMPAYNFYASTILVALAPILLAMIPINGLLRDRKVQKKEREIMDLKQQFVSVASHELRSPLSGLLWAMQSMMRPTVDNLTPEQKTMLDNMHRSAESSMTTVNEILDLTIFERSKDTKRDEVIDLVKLVDDSQQALRLSAQAKNIDIIMAQTWPKETFALGNSAALRRGFMNIIANAIKYSSENSSITISYRQDNNQHVVGVIDHGIGIPEAELGKVMGGYYRASNAVSTEAHGTGIGLYVTKIVFEQHHGSLEIDSKENKGTTVYVRLPIFKQPG